MALGVSEGSAARCGAAYPPGIEWSGDWTCQRSEGHEPPHRIRHHDDTAEVIEWADEPWWTTVDSL